MDIGLLGTGNLAVTLGRAWAGAGHPILVTSGVRPAVLGGLDAARQAERRRDSSSGWSRSAPTRAPRSPT